MKTNLFFLSLLAAMTMALFSCKDKEPIKVDPAFASYVNAFTSGTISSNSPIRIRFNSAFSEEQKEKILQNQPLSMSPSVHGVLAWEDDYTLSFNADEALPSGEEFIATLSLGDILEVPEEMSTFQFSFRTLEQNLEVNVDEVRNYRIDNLKSLYLTGVVNTWDAAKEEKLQMVLTASQDGRTLPVSWSHDVSRKRHSFVVDSIHRSEKASEVVLKWNGEPIAAKADGETIQEIPSLSDFKLLKTHVIQHPEQYVELIFSDPISENVDLTGLLSIQGGPDVSTVLDQNSLKIYPTRRLTGEHTLEVFTGVKNILGYALKEQIQIPVTFEELKPQVRFVNEDNTILPSTKGMVLPFEAVSLAAVEVRVIRVYQNNVPQFLQVNNLNGTRELKRSGRLVAKKEVRLDDGKTNLGAWNRFYLDLDDLVEEEPGSIYRIQIGFQQKHSVYQCSGDVETTELLEETENWDENDSEASYWDYFDSYYYDYWYGDYYYDYDYDQRDNPCDKAYYLTRRPIATNILASDLGVIVKQGNDGSVNVAVNNIKTTEPVSGAAVRILDFQQQELSHGVTDSKGFFEVPRLDHKAFLAEVRSNAGYAYLKLDDGSSLTLSKFDVSGSSVDKGLKGFIYGERGVWRPGDTLFLGFILEEQSENLPASHPIYFELKDARGKLVEKQVLRKGNDRIFPFHVATSDEAPTGNWQLNVRTGGATFSKSLSVETIKPNRLKILIDFNKEVLSSTDSELEGKLQVNWLHGAPAGNLKAVVKSTFVPVPTKFKTHTDFNFDDPTRRFSFSEKVIFEKEVNSEGSAKLDMDVELGSPPAGMLKAYFNSKVFEKGGEFSVDRFSIPYSPYSHYVGVRLPKGDKARGMLLTDEKHAVDVVSFDSEGNPASNRRLSYEFFKIHWSWWWENYSDNLSQYNGNTGMLPISSGEVTTNAKGEASFPIEVNYPDWGRYMVRVTDMESDHSTATVVYLDWPGWAGRAQRENPGGASMLVLSADKEKYNVGEYCEVSFPSSGVGRALVSIESGSKVIKADWVEAQNEISKYRFEITPDMAPNVYLNVTLLQPHAQTENNLPLRMYGVVPVMVEDPNTHLQPQIIMSDVLEPEKNFQVKVKEKQGKKMSYTLAVVDEGLLDLTRFETPDPWNYFYAREALGVKTWDIYDDVIGAWGTDMQRLLAIGGGGSLKNKGKNKVNRFKPVVMYLGPFELEAGKTATHDLTMPNYIGSVRTMVVAASDGAYGSAEKATPVKTPLMVLSTLPRVLSPGESVKFPVTVFAMDEKIKDVEAEVKISGPLKVMTTNKKKISFRKIGDQIVNFDLKAEELEGAAFVEVTVRSGNESAKHKIEIMISNPNPYETRVQEAVLEANVIHSFDYQPFGMTGTNEAYVEVSGIPNVDFGRRLQYLLGYPHGCVEQTTSRAFPQLFLSDVIELTEQERARKNQNIRAAVQRLIQFQNHTGGLSYWPGQNNVNDWSTSYAGHFLLEAEKKGFALDKTFRKKWLAYQKENARNWKYVNNDHSYHHRNLVQAYRLYTLALAGSPEIGAMNRLKEEQNNSETTKWMLAAAYALSGKTQTANAMVEGLSTRVDAYNELGGTFGSSLRDRALIVEALILLDKKEKVASLVQEIAKELNASAWYSTQSTAQGLMAISKYAGGMYKQDIRMIYNSGNGATEYSSSKPIIKIPVQVGENKIELKNQSGLPLYAKLVSRGQPLTGTETNASSDLDMTVTYKDMDGNTINVNQLEAGTDFMCEVKVRHTGLQRRVDNLALTQVFPSGWEILNSRMNYSGVDQASIPDYQDIRDDRVLSYFDLRKGESKTFKILLNSSYQGHYYHPAVSCEAMYDEKIHARKAGQWVDVVSSSKLANKNP